MMKPLLPATTSKVRAAKLMEKLDISASRRIRGLGAKQRESLLGEFSKK